jgi:hypothetical protein
MADTLLIATVGNRDLQLLPEVPLTDDQNALFMHFSEHSNHKVIRRDPKKGIMFRECSKQLRDQHASSLSEAFCWPMIEGYLQHIRQESGQATPVDVCLVATGQQPPHDTDTDIMADLLASLLEPQAGIDSVWSKQINAQPNRDFNSLTTFFTHLFDQLTSQYSSVYVGNSGGTPLMSSTSQMGGLFRGLHFVYTQADGTTNEQNYQAFEKQVLRQKLLALLDQHEYDAMLAFRQSLSTHTINQIRQAQRILNLNGLEIGRGKRWGDYARQGIQYLVANIKALYTKGIYADIVGRLYRLEEASGQLLFYEWAREKGYINNKDQFFIDERPYPAIALFSYPQNFIRLLKRAEEQGEYPYSSAFPKKEPPINKDRYKLFFQQIGYYQEFYDFWGGLDGINVGKKGKANSLTLKDLRNQSIVGHDFREVTKDHIDAIFDKHGGHDAFFDRLYSLLEQHAGIPPRDPLGELQTEIRNLVKAT